MAGFFPQQWLDELRSRADIVSVVSEYVPLTQKGRRYWGCCPFHQERRRRFPSIRKSRCTIASAARRRGM